MLVGSSAPARVANARVVNRGTPQLPLLEKSAARTSPALLPMHVPGRSRVSGAIAIA